MLAFVVVNSGVVYPLKFPSANTHVTPMYVRLSFSSQSHDNLFRDEELKLSRKFIPQQGYWSQLYETI